MKNDQIHQLNNQLSVTI